MISIGAHYGGPELRGGPLNLAIQRIAGIVKDLRAESEIRLNAIFYVPGSLTNKVPFDGLRYGQFSPSPPCLVVQVAIGDSTENDPIQLLLQALRGCNALAFEFYRQKGLFYPLADVENLINSVEKRIAWGD
ncbi:hypothetical protein [Lysobacter sp. Root916]|uniref:hypothetical protein n=1 Tax=Lysobacter sp. Root916 TaxID=1736606 RepID=UPI0012FC587B|nr:hypothetical protein [Lysobacter sp. Root916]